MRARVSFEVGLDDAAYAEVFVLSEFYSISFHPSFSGCKRLHSAIISSHCSNASSQVSCHSVRTSSFHSHFIHSSHRHPMRILHIAIIMAVNEQ